MKKRILAVLTATFWLLLCVSTATAANRVPEMEIQIALRSDGSACITQIWTTDTEEGTEFYLGLKDRGYLSITDFSVSDKNGVYTLVKEWDVNATRQEKAGKCGILETDEGVELCWGISEYGENRYVIEYVLHGLVGSYADADGFLHRFVDEMSFFPTDVVLTICNQDGSPLRDEDCDIWGFGFDGQVQFENGEIRAWSESPLESGQYMTLLLSLEKGLLTPERMVDGSFEDVKAQALEDSDYDYQKDSPEGDGAEGSMQEGDLIGNQVPEEEVELTAGDYIFTAAFFGSIVLFVRWLFGAKKRKRAKEKKRLEQVEYFRDAPNQGNLNVTYQMGRSDGLCEEGAFLGAYLLRLIADGALVPVETGSDSETVSLRLIRGPRTDNAFDEVLYTVLEASAGEDGILQSDELERYCRRNRKPLAAFVNSCNNDAIQTMQKAGWIKHATCNRRRDLTEQGLKQLDQILGLKRFLMDFSLINERGVNEAVIWQDYMVYAMLFGIADQVAPQIKELYPEALPQIQQYERSIVYASQYHSILYNSYITGQWQQQTRSAGSGGRVSTGGGSGCSGGGRGGTR